MKNYPNLTAGAGYNDPCETCEKTEIYLIDCPEDCGGDPKCKTCYGAGTTFNVDLDDIFYNTNVECPFCGKMVDVNEINYNKCEECNRKEDAAEEAELESLLAEIDKHKNNIEETKEPQRPFLFECLIKYAAKPATACSNEP
jgi:DNA-binding XRE family transcriptional regulator